MDRRLFDFARGSRIHFVGIGGIGMSGLARLMHAQGYRVQGSDTGAAPILEQLNSAGIRVFHEHSAALLEGVDAVIVSSSIAPENVEYQAARQQHIPVLLRGELLAMLSRHIPTIAVTGCHGKTTTTSMVAHLLTCAGLDPIVLSGGIMHNTASNVRLGEGSWLVTESDESDGTFERLSPEISVLTNVDHDHVGFYGSADALDQRFTAFLSRLNQAGKKQFVCADSPHTQKLLAQSGARVSTYGFTENADIKLSEPVFKQSSMIFDAVAASADQSFEALRLGVLGRHNVQNAGAVIALAHHLGLPEAVLRKALATFSGVARRFSLIGTASGVAVVDDYAHHPEEVRVTLETARQVCEGRLIAVIEPHRYTRLRDLFGEFVACCGRADHIFVAPVYSAGEPPIADISAQALARTIAQTQTASTADTYSALLPMVLEAVRPDDMILCMGAGLITRFARDVLAGLEKRSRVQAADGTQG